MHLNLKKFYFLFFEQNNNQIFYQYYRQYYIVLTQKKDYKTNYSTIGLTSNTVIVCSIINVLAIDIFLLIQIKTKS